MLLLGYLVFLVAYDVVWVFGVVNCSAVVACVWRCVFGLCRLLAGLVAAGLRFGSWLLA